jgi:hypothetical protein
MNCDVEKVFANKPGFLPDNKTKFLILDKVEIKNYFINKFGLTKKLHFNKINYQNAANYCLPH